MAKYIMIIVVDEVVSCGRLLVTSFENLKDADKCINIILMMIYI